MSFLSQELQKLVNFNVKSYEMNKWKINRKIEESLKRQRQREIVAHKKERDSKKKKGEIITALDYHPSGHIRHGK